MSWSLIPSCWSADAYGESAADSSLRHRGLDTKPCQWLGWIANSSFVAACKPKFISMFGESSHSLAQPSSAYCLTMSTLSRQRRLGCPWAKDSCLPPELLQGNEQYLGQSGFSTKCLWQTLCINLPHPGIPFFSLIICLWFPSCPLFPGWNFCNSNHDTALPKTGSKETSFYDWPHFSICCEYDVQYWNRI